MDGRKRGWGVVDSDGGVETGRGNLEGGNGEREMGKGAIGMRLKSPNDECALGAVGLKRHLR